MGVGTQNPDMYSQLDVEATGQTNIALYTNATGSGNNNNYGIYASASNATNNYAGYFNGDVYTTGSYLPSDATIKSNIDSITNCSNILCRLKPRTFNYNTNIAGMNLPTGTHYGLIAQDVQTVLPNIVKTIVQPAVKDTSGKIIDSSVSFKAVNYTEIVPILVKAYQEQKTTIDSLRNMLTSLQSCITSLCDSSHDRKAFHEPTPQGGGLAGATIDVILSNSAVLYQNTPNPFSSGTKINYYLPEGTVGALIVFYDMYGNKMKEVQLQQTGMGTLNITPDNLSNGMYSYSLIINGQLVDTKKMVLQK